MDLVKLNVGLSKGEKILKCDNIHLQSQVDLLTLEYIKMYLSGVIQMDYTINYRGDIQKINSKAYNVPIHFLKDIIEVQSLITDVISEHYEKYMIEPRQIIISKK